MKRPFLSILIVLGLCTAGTAVAQPCTSHALSSVTKARSAFIGGNEQEARSWLERASNECSTSETVIRQIAELYGVMGDDSKARLFESRADSLSKGPALKLNQPAGVPETGTKTEDEPSFVRDKWALIVGISNFKNPKYNLQFPAKDAKDLAALLADPRIGRFPSDDQHIKLLTNEEATVAGIKTALNDLTRAARADDLVVLFFSSHGFPAKADVAMEEGQTGYIVTYETDINNLYATAFPMNDLIVSVEKRLKARRVVAFMDTCFSGDAFKQKMGAKAMEIGIADSSWARVAQGKGRVVISSSSSTEKSWESEQFKNGYFTHFLLDGLSQNQGLSTITQLFNHLQKKVPAAVRADPNALAERATQVPVMWPERNVPSIVLGTALQP